MAPSSDNERPSEFILVEDRKRVGQIAELKAQNNRNFQGCFLLALLYFTRG